MPLALYYHKVDINKSNRFTCQVHVICIDFLYFKFKDSPILCILRLALFLTDLQPSSNQRLFPQGSEKNTTNLQWKILISFTNGLQLFFRSLFNRTDELARVQALEPLNIMRNERISQV